MQKTKAKRGVLTGNEKWTVSVYMRGNEQLIMDEFYLFSLDFIYGDYRQQKQLKQKTPYTSQFVGSDPICKVRITGDGVADRHGKIRFEQDWGLVYEAFHASGSSFKKRPGDKDAYKTYIDYAMGEENLRVVEFVKITDGLRLYIGDRVLLFEKSDIVYPKEKYEVYQEEFSGETNENELRNIKDVVKGACEAFKNGWKKCVKFLNNRLSDKRR